MKKRSISILFNVIGFVLMTVSIGLSADDLFDNLDLQNLNAKGQLSLSVDAVGDSLQQTNPFDIDSNQVDPIVTQVDTVPDVKPDNALDVKSNKAPDVKKDQLQKQTQKKKPVVEQPAPPRKPVRPRQLKKQAEVDKPNIVTSAVKQEIAGQRDEERIIFNFENADLKNVISYVESIFDVKFITDEAIQPMLKTGKAVKGNLTFKTHEPLTKDQAWGLFVTFLKMAGLAAVPQTDPKLYRIVALATAFRSPIRSFIGVEPEVLPDNDEIIRYGYFIKDCQFKTIIDVVKQLQGQGTPPLIGLEDHNAFIITDSAYNIKVLMQVVKELDRVTMPQTMSVLKLRRVEARDVEKLYKDLTAQEYQRGVAARIFGPKKTPTALYFPENAKMIVEERTNSLILLGTQKAIETIENFITKHIDIELDAPYSPLHIYDLRYAKAGNIAQIMTNLVKFGQGNVRQVGGVRAGEKYFKPMTFTPESDGNRLIVRGDEDDWLKIKEIIAKLDEPQPQVSIEILILSIDLKDTKELGAQIRRKEPLTSQSPSKNITFQTSGMRLGQSAQGIVENEEGTGVTRLLGDLINLVKGTGVTGNSVLSLGNDKWGVWGIFNALKSVSNTQLISNPFLMVTNNTPAVVTLGETRRVESSKTISSGETPAFANLPANLVVNVRPQINSEGMIVLNLDITIDTFIEATVASMLKKNIKTTVIVSDREVLALGGLIKARAEDNVTKVPVLGNIPILGWLFKNKKKAQQKEDLLILISAHIVAPDEGDASFTNRHIKGYKTDLAQVEQVQTKRDPIDRAMFISQSGTDEVESLIFKGTDYKETFEQPVEKKKSSKELRQERKEKRRQERKAKKERRKKERESKRKARREKRINKKEEAALVNDVGRIE